MAIKTLFERAIRRTNINSRISVATIRSHFGLIDDVFGQAFALKWARLLAHAVAVGGFLSVPTFASSRRRLL